MRLIYWLQFIKRKQSHQQHCESWFLVCFHPQERNAVENELLSSSWVDNWWGLEGSNTQEHRFFLGKQQDKVPGMFPMAQRVNVGALALPGQCQTPRPGSGVCQSTGAAAEPSPASPSPAGAGHTPGFGGLSSIPSLSQLALLSLWCCFFSFRVNPQETTGWYQWIEGGVLSQSFLFGLLTAHFQWDSSDVLFSTPPACIRQGNQLATHRNISWPRFRRFMNFEPLAGCRNKMLCWK